MLSQSLIWESTPPGRVCAREQSALTGCRGPQELLIGKAMPGSTALAGCREPQELLSQTCAGTGPRHQDPDPQHCPV
jgi:hypothetical protein